MKNEATWLHDAENKVLEFLETATPNDVSNKIANYNEQMKYIVTDLNNDTWKFANIKMDPAIDAELASIEENTQPPMIDPAAERKLLVYEAIVMAAITEFFQRHDVATAYVREEFLNRVAIDPALAYNMFKEVSALDPELARRIILEYSANDPELAFKIIQDAFKSPNIQFNTRSARAARESLFAISAKRF